MTSPFDWKADPRRSIFADDARFQPVGKQRKSYSQLGAEQIARRTRETGKSPGTLIGITRRKDRRG